MGIRNVVLNQDCFGTKINFIEYLAPVKTNNWLVFLHGRGEVGPVDGSQIGKVEIHGFPREAKNGREFPFNIIAPQCASSWGSTTRFLLQWLRLYKGAESIGVTGLSLGGQETYNLALRHTDWSDKLIDFIVPVAGRPDAYSTADPASMKDVPCLAVHGDQDNTVPYSQDKAWIEKVAAVPGRVNIPELITLNGVGHNAWDYAYSSFGVYNFIIDNFKKPVTDEFEQGRKDGINYVKSIVNNL